MHSSISIKHFAFLAAIIFLFCGCNNAFQKAVSTIQQQSSPDWETDLFYSTFTQQYKIVIGYSASNESGNSLSTDRYIICFNNSHSGMAYSFSRKYVQMVNSPTPDKWDGTILTKKMTNKILKQFNHTTGWKLGYNDTENPDDYCPPTNGKPCVVLHGLTYRVDYINGTNGVRSILYAPDRYETECCSGNINRQKLLVIKKAIQEIFPEKEK